MALRHSFFGDQDHRLLWVSRHYLLAHQDIRQRLEVVNELGVIVREQEIVVQPFGQIGRKFQLRQHVLGKWLLAGVYEDTPLLKNL